MASFIDVLCGRHSPIVGDCASISFNLQLVGSKDHKGILWSQWHCFWMRLRCCYVVVGAAGTESQFNVMLILRWSQPLALRPGDALPCRFNIRLRESGDQRDIYPFSGFSVSRTLPSNSTICIKAQHHLLCSTSLASQLKRSAINWNVSSGGSIATPLPCTDEPHRNFLVGDLARFRLVPARRTTILL